MQPPGSGSETGPDAIDDDDDDDADFADQPTKVHEIVLPARAAERKRGPLREGAVVANKYELRELIAKGGMGTIWRARDQLLERPVAVKFMDRAIASDETLRERFVREAKAAARLRTMHVVQIYDFGIEADVPFIVMELLEGEDLHATLKRQAPLPLEEAAWLVNETAKGLQVAHDAAVVHRDLKPQNVFLSNHANETVVKILDFGVAKLRGADFSGFQTAIGTVLGSPNYMSPEQARGKPDIDHRADLWSLAVIAFRAVTGKLAFPGDMAALVIVRICAEALPVPSQVLPGLPKEMDAFFERALQREPALRFQSAFELANAFNAAVRFAGAGPPRPIRFAQRPRVQSTAVPITSAGSSASAPRAAVGPTPPPRSATPVSGSPAPWAVPVGTPVPTPHSPVPGTYGTPAPTPHSPVPGFGPTPNPTPPGQQQTFAGTPPPTPMGLGPYYGAAEQPPPLAAARAPLPTPADASSEQVPPGPPVAAGPVVPESPVAEARRRPAAAPAARPRKPSSPLGLSSLAAGPTIPPPADDLPDSGEPPRAAGSRAVEIVPVELASEPSQPKRPDDHTAQTRVTDLAADVRKRLADADAAAAADRAPVLPLHDEASSAEVELDDGTEEPFGGLPAGAADLWGSPLPEPASSAPSAPGLTDEAPFDFGAERKPGGGRAELRELPASEYDVETDANTMERRFPAAAVAAAEAALAQESALTDDGAFADIDQEDGDSGRWAARRIALRRGRAPASPTAAGRRHRWRRGGGRGARARGGAGGCRSEPGPERRIDPLDAARVLLDRSAAVGDDTHRRRRGKRGGRRRRNAGADGHEQRLHRTERERRRERCGRRRQAQASEGQAPAARLGLLTVGTRADVPAVDGSRRTANRER
jgi:serine/threonine-protein kinase